jgi:hypothetical protein
MPPYWKSFIDKHGLVGREISVPADADASGVGAEIEILDEQVSAAEQNEFYPGIAVLNAGFVPVGGCSFATGDPYFICTRDGEGGPLYRIYHDEVTDGNYDASRAITVVLSDYQELLRFVR